MQYEQVIRRPLVTEKATKTIESQNAYVFEVDKKADKPAIKAAIEAIYGVRVLRVTTQNRKGEMRRNRYGHFRQGVMKRAIVTVHPEESIELF
ncbi:MAG: 50S ribosomal protein L23 [Phycisphaerae bacterium]|nr:50S ribosomal protein L23 [Phycisphaerae bacterium]